MDEPGSQNKPFEISKWVVWEAYRRVKANRGAPGVDGCGIEEFEQDLKNNLFKIWNRMSSGSYFPSPVRAVEIPKPHGAGTRMLGIPTVADRVAQTVAAMYLERQVEPIFHSDSYGYRPRRSALDAVAACRRRCWKADWVIELDIQKFFDSVPWDLVIKAVRAHTNQPWLVLYVIRWLQAPVQHRDGALVARDRGTPQGSAISPILANLFLHYAFDVWMARRFPAVTFERYADDVVVHCVTERQARMVRAAIAERMASVGLRLHPDKTKIVYCKDGKRRGDYKHTKFTFLGYTFRPRKARDRHGEKFTSFLPAMSRDALTAKGREVRRWRLHRQVGQTLGDLARWMNPIVRGWMDYYGRFYRSAVHALLHRINTYLMRWARKKYRRLRSVKRFKAWWTSLVQRAPTLFTQWRWTNGILPTGW